MIKNEVHGLKVTRDIAKTMFPEEYAIGEAFENKLQTLISETLEENKGKGMKAFSAISASMTMELVKLFAISGTDPVSVIKTFTDVMMSVYSDVADTYKEKHEKAK